MDGGEVEGEGDEEVEDGQEREKPDNASSWDACCNLETVTKRGYGLKLESIP